MDNWTPEILSSNILYMCICGKKKDLKICSKCHKNKYCSSTCQKEDWSRHKINCGKNDDLVERLNCYRRTKCRIYDIEDYEKLEKFMKSI